MIITFGEAKSLLSRFAAKAGACRDDGIVSLFVKSVIQELLNKGAHGNIRRWEFYTQNGVLTLPPDLLLPTHIKIIGPCERSEIGRVYDKFYEFYESETLENYNPWEKGAVEQPNTYFTQYDLPACGARILAVPRCVEDCDSHLVLQGTDQGGLDIYVPKKDGLKEKGEYLSIDKQLPKYTEATFKTITSIEKCTTRDYVRLYWYNPETKEKGLLADLRPNDTRPSFRRARILGCDPRFPTKVVILGRVRFYDNYVDSDIIPITSLRALRVQAQAMQAEENDNVQLSQAKEASVMNIVNNENQYNRTPQAQVNFEPETSPGSIRTIT